jgi:hypothetical protein
MWRALSRAFGVLEAGSALAARAWIERRPDIDAIVVDDALPDQRGVDLVSDLLTARCPAASRAIVLARKSARRRAAAEAGVTVVDRGDVRSVVSKLASWFLARDVAKARALLREVERIRRFGAA